MRPRIALPDDAQAIEREQIVHGLDVLGVFADQPRQPAGSDYLCFGTKAC